jgi:glycosyltransferase involved in cell wall biosynthesis
MSPELSQVCLLPRLTGVGGMVTFQGKLTRGLQMRGLSVSHDLADSACQAALVIGGTRHLGELWRARKRGVRIVQRLDGMNWLHRRLRTGLRHYLRAEYGNLLLAFIRSRLADEIVYQSLFSKTWWERVRGPVSIPDRVIYNGVDLDAYSPGDASRPQDRWRVLMVEGSLMGGYEMGLEAAVHLAEELAERVKNDPQLSIDRQVELVVVGRVAAEVQHQTNQRSSTHIRWEGLVEQARIPDIDRSAHMLFAADLNAACPNSVIEALACGLPVISFGTGALPEMVTTGAGKLVPYGGDPWQLDPPDYAALADAAHEITQDQDSYRKAARRRAEQAFALDQMVLSYIDVMAGNS